MVVQLIRNQQVAGSNPVIGLCIKIIFLIQPEIQIVFNLLSYLRFSGGKFTFQSLEGFVVDVLQY